jgi:hypothetical protein
MGDDTTFDRPEDVPDDAVLLQCGVVVGDDDTLGTVDFEQFERGGE